MTMRFGWLAEVAAMMISAQADAARWVRFTFSGPGEIAEGNINDPDLPPVFSKDIVASFAIDVEPNDPFDGGDQLYFSTGSFYNRVLPFEGFTASVNAGTFDATEQFTDVKAGGDSRLTFALANDAGAFADVASGVGVGSLQYWLYSGAIYRSASASLTRLTVSDATGYEALNITAVPEPATWALMILGFGAVGAQLRRERAGAVLAVA